MLTESWTQLRYHPQQDKLWRTKARFVGVAAGRGSGKTELARRRVVRMLAVRKPWMDPLYFYALPTYAQAKRVAWNQLAALIPREWLKGEPNKSDLSFTTKFGSTLLVVGMDKPQRIEGNQYDGGVVDESSDQRPGAFDKSIRPALTHRNGWAWRIGVPKRVGCGAAEFRKFCNGGAEESYTWPSWDILPPEEIEQVKEDTDPQDFNEQYGAAWLDLGGGIFYAFTEQLNVSAAIAYDPTRPVLVGSDFNVNPMCWELGHVYKAPDGVEELHVFDELCIHNTNTPATLDALHRRYGSHPAGWDFYGDASGRARKTSATTTDYLLIKNDRRFANSRVHYPHANPLFYDRVSSCNAMFCNANGRRRCIVHPRCRRLIADMQDRNWKDGIREPDDSGDVGHASDALGYIIHYRWPVRYVGSGVAPSVHISTGG